MGCSSSTPKGTLTSWEEHCTSKFAQLTMQTTWMTDSLNASARIELTVARDGEKLLALDGGYVYASGGQCHPSDAVITARGEIVPRARHSNAARRGRVPTQKELVQANVHASTGLLGSKWRTEKAVDRDVKSPSYR